eukprot:gene3335-1683_t
MKMLVLSWDEVTEKTVHNCFKKVGFIEIDDNTSASDDPFHALKDSLRQSDEQILSDILGKDAEEIQEDEDFDEDAAHA